MSKTQSVVFQKVRIEGIQRLNLYTTLPQVIQLLDHRWRFLDHIQEKDYNNENILSVIDSVRDSISELLWLQILDPLTKNHMWYCMPTAERVKWIVNRKSGLEDFLPSTLGQIGSRLRFVKEIYSAYWKNKDVIFDAVIDDYNSAILKSMYL